MTNGNQQSLESLSSAKGRDDVDVGDGPPAPERSEAAGLEAITARSRQVVDLAGEYYLLYRLDTRDHPAQLCIEAYYHADPEQLRRWRCAGGPPELVSPALLEQTLACSRSMTVGPVEPPSDRVASSTWGRSAAVLAPLTTSHGDPIGVLVVGGERESGGDRSRLLALVETLADDLAVRLENAELREQLQTMRTQLERTIDLQDHVTSVVTHELRSPLSTIQLLAQLLRREAPHADDPNQTAASENILTRADSLERQVRRMSSLIDRLSEVAKLSSSHLELQPRDVDLVALVEDVLETYRDSDTVSDVHLEAPNAVRGEWDPNYLERAVSNLVDNAVAYGEDRPIVITLDSNDNHCDVYIRDHGHGLPEDEHDRLFERFECGGHANSEEGLGVGLWVSRRIVEAFGGSLTMTSISGEGTECHMRLPRRVS